jgi:PII-like signaling protein
VSDDCLKLTAYFSERRRSGSRFQADVLLELCERHALQTSVLLRGAEGFGTRHVLQTERLLSLSEDLPVVVVGVDSRPRIEAAVPDFEGAMAHGLLTLERARMSADADGLDHTTKLTVYCGRYERLNGRPAFVEIVDLLHRHGAAGATVLLGVDGTARGSRRRARFVGRNADVPLMIIALGEGSQIADVLRVLPERPLVTLERIRICKLEGASIAEPHAPAELGPEPALVKLMVHAGFDSTHAGRPLYTEIVRRLRAAGASGATVLPGIWGYYGRRPPQGDRLLSLRRHVPTTTVVIDTAKRAAEWFGVIDELTTEAGLVTSELVPVLITPAASEPTRSAS